MTRRLEQAARWWPRLLALLIAFPVLAPGFVLSYDMVFVPDLALRPDFWGTSTGLPRAVPSDAVVALVDEIVPGAVLQKAMLVAVLVLAGAGARRLVPADLPVAQLAATSLYVWNPYVGERLALGHWPVLLAYAALPWVVDAARRLREGSDNHARSSHLWAVLVLWLAVGSLSASGGILVSVAALAFVTDSSTAGMRRALTVGALALALNAPWVVAGLLHGSAAVTDAAGVEVFAAHGEGWLPAPLAVLGLGGVWNSEVVPATRLGATAVVSLVLVLAVCAVGVRAWWHRLSRADTAAFLVCAGTGLLVALLGSLAPGLLGWLVAHVPGAGLLRDGPRLLGLLALLQASLFGFGAVALAALLRERAGRVALAGGAVVLPLTMMPDLAAGLAGRLQPVSYPPAYADARGVLAEQATARDASVLLLPFTSYRRPEWNEDRRVLDPLGRYLTPDYVASDELFVSGRPVAGEDPRARRIARLLDEAEAGTLAPTEASSGLRAEGVGWVALDQHMRSALEQPVPGFLAGKPVLFDSPELTLWSLPGPTASTTVDAADRVALWTAWLAAGLTVAGAALRGLGALARGGKRISRSQA